jgi:hypothetical protein
MTTLHLRNLIDRLRSRFGFAFILHALTLASFALPLTAQASGRGVSIEGAKNQSAHTITAALVTIGAIEIVAKGKARSNSRKAAEFRYLQSEGDNGAQADHDGEVQI